MNSDAHSKDMQTAALEINLAAFPRAPDKELPQFAHDLPLHAIPLFTFLAIATSAALETGTGDMPGLWLVILFILGAGVWSGAFAFAMILRGIQGRHWSFLTIAAVLLAARLIFFHELDYLYLWIPAECFVFYLFAHPDTKWQKLRFAAITFALFALCVGGVAFTIILLAL